MAPPLHLTFVKSCPHLMCCAAQFNFDFITINNVLVLFPLFRFAQKICVVSDDWCKQSLNNCKTLTVCFGILVLYSLTSLPVWRASRSSLRMNAVGISIWMTYGKCLGDHQDEKVSAGCPSLSSAHPVRDCGRLWVHPCLLLPLFWQVPTGR